jgi:hypothetical protein
VRIEAEGLALNYINLSSPPVSPQRGTQQIYFIRGVGDKWSKTSIRGVKSSLGEGVGGFVHSYRIPEIVTCTASLLMRALVPP